MANTPIIVRSAGEVESVHMIKFVVFVRTVKGVLCVNIIELKIIVWNVADW
jgi:hypothetical protein